MLRAAFSWCARLARSFWIRAALDYEALYALFLHGIRFMGSLAIKKEHKTMPSIISGKHSLSIHPAVSPSVASFCTVTVDEVVLTRKALHRYTAAGARKAMTARKLHRLYQPQGIINVFGMGIFVISATGVVAASLGSDLSLAGQAAAAVVGIAIGIRATLSN